MPVQFILGRSGAGKSSYCIRTIVDALCQSDSNQQLLLLVPEQATYQAERAILADKRISGYNRLNVVSFDRLQFLLLNKNTAKPVLSKIGQQMIIARILREQKNNLKVFADTVHWGGLSQQMSQTIAELHKHAKNEEDVEQLLQNLGKDDGNKLVAMKFADIGLVFKEYLKFIETRFIDPDVQLNLARQAASESDIIKGAKLWVDGFAGFTASEQAVLTEMLKAAEETKIALCLDPAKADFENPSTVGLFAPIERTYADLVETVRNCKLTLLEPIVLKQAERFSGNGTEHIEQNIFDASAEKIAAPENIRIVSAANARSEVEFVVQQILRLVRQKGLRYRDIAVIASDMDSYQYYIKAYFDDYGVPFFIDKRKSLAQHVVVHLLSSAFDVISGGFSSSDIFAYLKTGLALPDSGEIALLENYCLAFGVQGKDWTNGRKWNFQDKQKTYFDEQRVNKIRSEVAAPLLELRERLCPDGDIKRKSSAEEFVKIVFDFLERLKVGQMIAEWLEEAEKNKQAAVSEEHQQFYSRLLDIFDELVEVFDGLKLGCDDFIGIVNSAFSQMTMAFIPPTLDQVLVGSIERSRHPDLKAVFLIGVTQKQFPVPIGNEGLLSNCERQAAEEFDFCLGGSVSSDLAERQYLAYIAFTRASDFLYVSYPVRDNSGKGVVRSQFAGDLGALFCDLKEESVLDEKLKLIDFDKSEISPLRATLRPSGRNDNSTLNNRNWCENPPPPQAAGLNGRKFDDLSVDSSKKKKIDGVQSEGELAELLCDLKEESVLDEKLKLTDFDKPEISPLRATLRPSGRNDNSTLNNRNWCENPPPPQATGLNGREFDDLSVGSSKKKKIDYIQNEGELAELLCTELGKGKGSLSANEKTELAGLLDELCADEQLAELGTNIKSAIEYDNTAVLEKAVTEKLFGKQIKSSATRLGVYAACPYKYFARYILNLKERQEFKLRPLDIGNFYHRILDGLLKSLLASKKNFDNICDDELLDILRRQISTLLEKDAFISNFISHRRHNSFIIHSGCEVLEEFVLAMAKMIRAGDFRPVNSEVCFGEKSDELGEYKLSFDQGRELLLRGKIDRFDIANVNGEKIGVVFDYKRKGKGFDWSYFYHGLDLQLAIYMLAAVNGNKQLKVDRIAGAFYMPVEVSPEKVTFDELEKSSDKFRYKAKGIFDGEFYQSLDSKLDSGWSEFYNFRVSTKESQYGNYAISGALKAEDFKDVLGFAEEKIISLTQKMVSGCIEISPYKLKKETPCSYCEYKSVCRFDWDVDGYNYLESIDKKEFFVTVH